MEYWGKEPAESECRFTPILPYPHTPLPLYSISQQIVAEARSWLGTRFAHQGRLKATAAHQGGCDCLGLLVGVASALKLERRIGGNLRALRDFDRTDYGHIPDGRLLCRYLAEALEVIDPREARPGDVLVFRFDGNPQHMGIVSDYPLGGPGVLGLIHAFAEARRVVEHRLDEVWQGRIVTAYRF